MRVRILGLFQVLRSTKQRRKVNGNRGDYLQQGQTRGIEPNRVLGCFRSNSFRVERERVSAGQERRRNNPQGLPCPWYSNQECTDFGSAHSLSLLTAGKHTKGNRRNGKRRPTIPSRLFRQYQNQTIQEGIQRA